ncbi:unnamed protein product [Larinioides sclopetarius]|uniref:C2H2-type domain-containing protein n=1 Tax=Larinioides sclopetarius TaxID=280406 RepID=A0AAV2AUT7_9ARAC
MHPGMEENISENRLTTAQIIHSNEIILPIPIGDFDEQLNESPHDTEIYDTDLGDTGNSVKNIKDGLVAAQIAHSSEIILPTPIGDFDEQLNESPHDRGIYDTDFRDNGNPMKNKLATTHISHSNEIILPTPVEDFLEQLNESLENNEIYDSDFRDTGNSKKNVREDSYACKMCGLVFYTKQSILNHLLVHANQKDCVPEEALRTFSERNNIVPHLHVHKSAESFNCEVCGKSFRNVKCLRSHFRTHTNNRPYVCNICKQAFKWKSNLTSHSRIHTKDKPFICVVCCERFNRRVKLGLTAETAGLPRRSISERLVLRRGSVPSALILMGLTHSGPPLHMCVQPFPVP